MQRVILALLFGGFALDAPVVEPLDPDDMPAALSAPLHILRAA